MQISLFRGLFDETFKKLAEGANLEGGVRGVRPPFYAYLPVYIL